MASISFADIVAAFKAASDADKAEFRHLLAPAKDGASTTSRKSSTAVSVTLPDATYGVPTADDYRVDATTIDPTLCQGRELKGGKDDRWTPHVYAETQCQKKPVKGTNLCTVCARRQDAYEPQKPGAWNGFITGPIMAHTHMLGSAWALAKAPKFIGAAAPAPVVPVVPAPAVAAAVAAPKEKKKEKTPEEAAAKAAAKAAKKAATAAKKAAKALAAEPAQCTKFIDGEQYVVFPNGNAYAVADGGTRGEYVGQYTKDADGDDDIDTDAPEKVEAEAEDDAE